MLETLVKPNPNSYQTKFPSINFQSECANLDVWHFWWYPKMCGEFQPHLWFVSPLPTSPGALVSSGEGTHRHQHLSAAITPLAPVTPRNIDHKSNLPAEQSHGTAPLQVSQGHFPPATVCKPLTHLSSRTDSRLRTLKLNDETYREKQNLCWENLLIL